MLFQSVLAAYSANSEQILSFYTQIMFKKLFTLDSQSGGKTSYQRQFCKRLNDVLL